MNSSMLAGERRWASQRRGGMTVLGKVAVPKPINLPSQRLENHGLDPNVEIVRKGTVSWGSRSSSSASNPWTSSSLSPNADGGTDSPTHSSGRPSSGGSGARPSTTGSDRTHVLVQNAWGSNSRPSSASGTFSSNHSSSASLRPRSAENRPNSAHLSRFAEPVSESSTAWGSSATAERLGVNSSKEDGFSLTSGDFPTLGSDKDNSVKNIESQDRSRPSSASGGINQAKDDTVPNSDVKHGPVNTWRADGPQNAEDGIHPSMEKWKGGPHQYPYANNPPQHFDAWRGPPMNGPAGGWYGGPPRGPPFSSNVPPGGFPLDPFPYYHRPQVPPPLLAGSQPVPPTGSRGPHPKNGDLYRPQMPDAYPHPSMPFRPGFYPGPPGPMPFEGYYGPPIGHHNNDRDIPYMGMRAATPVYNGYPPPNPDISNPPDRASGRGPAGKMMTEQLEANQREDAYGPKRIHIMRHGECDRREGGGNLGQIMQPNVSHPGRSHLHVSPRKNEWGAEEYTEEAVFAKRTANHADGPNIIGRASESLIVDPEGKMDGDSVPTHDLTDVHSQRAKMRELAKQRALQLQKEEEERIKEQKAKALAKLEELNRRTLAGDAANLMAERTQVIGDNTPTEQESYTVVGPMIAELNIEQSGFNIVPGTAVATYSNTYQALESVEVSKNLPLEIKPTGISVSNESPLPVNEDSHDSSTKIGASQVNDGSFSGHQRTGYKQRQNSSLQQSVNENSTSDIKSNESPSSDVRPSESNALNASSTVVEPPAQQRRKTDKSNKTKPKLDETSAAMALLPVASDVDRGNESIDYGESNDSLPNLESPVLTASEPDTKCQAQEVPSSLPNEESQSIASNQWKPHHYRRLPRSQQAHRFTDKLHGSDTVVWAPVRLQNKSKGSDDASQNSVQESANSNKDNNVGQNNSKGKRAEMERYVPKPVAKELAQQGNVPPLSSSVNSSRSITGSGWEKSGSVTSANPHCRPSVEIERDATDNHNKHKKDHETWKQRGSTNSSHVKGGNIGPSPTSEPIVDIPQSKELVQSGGSEITEPNSDAKISGKDQGATSRGKRHPQRGSRSIGKNPDSENTFSGEIDESSSIQSAVPNVNQIDRNIFSKENRSAGDRTSTHWQPKSRPHSANNHPQHNQSDNTSQLPTVNGDNNVAQGSGLGNHQEFNREKKPSPVNARPCSPSQDPLDSGECSTNTDDHLERNAPPGSRRKVGQNKRPIRGPDSHGDWSSGHDSRTAFRERQRQNMHYEYQPVGPMKVNKPKKSEEPADAGANNTDQSHRGRGHSHSKRGGRFHRRQSSAAHVGSGRE